MNAETILLTGATGFLGQYLLRDLLRLGVPLAVLVRGGRAGPAQARLDALLAECDAPASAPPPRCLDGDLTVPGLGLSAEDRRWAAQHCRTAIHNAASLTFEGKARDGDPWRTNIGGTGNVLAFCHEAGVRSFHYVSTAYVCGITPGPVAESSTQPAGPFRNDYEASKAEAEALVRAAGLPTAPTVYRPSVIVGDAVTGYTATYHGLYSYLQFVWLLQQHEPRDADGRWRMPLRLTATGRECRNLVPVDWVSAAIAHIATRPDLHGKAYHLTPEQPITMRELADAAADTYGFYGTEFVGPDGLDLAQANETEQQFYQYVSRYQHYWEAEPRFDCTNTLAALPHLPCPKIDSALIRRLIDFAVSDRWGRRRKKQAG